MNLFKELLDLKSFEHQDQTCENDMNIKLAAAVLMFEVVKADGDTNTMEVAEIVGILRDQFALQSDEIINLLEAVHKVNKDDFQIETFASKLSRHWGNRKRVKLLNDFWVIALADQERSVIKQLAQLLNLHHEEITRARFHAEQQIELNIG
ncbi:MAG: putative tellurite resistance protein B-like protein [Cryomorphaceae bacterium]|jgi:uncharacterized tellurite resistance protein B-like protein